MRKTLQITGDSPYGGAGYLILRWCKYLITEGWQVHILATNPQWVSMLKEIPELHIIEDIFIPRGISPLQDSAAFFQLTQLLKKEKYDVVHTYTATPGFVGRLAARMSRVPVILHHQAGWTVTEFSPLWHRLLFTPLEYLAVAASSKAICVSYAVEQQARKLKIASPKKLVVICNGIDPFPFMAASESGERDAFRNNMGISDGHLLIGNTGRLAPQKDNHTLIEGMAIFKNRNPQIPFSLLLAGDGPDRQELEKLAAAHNLKDEVRFLGFVSDIPQFLAGLDIFISPSLWEGLSISLLEAMAAAKPIITTTIAPNAELIEHERTGLVVPPKRPDEIADATLRLVQDQGLAQRCASAAQRRVLERYSIDRMFQETADLYLDLM
jgi:glycosyltransferase involved in cell wall biosynthesis